jgi:hypothetical protein
VVATGLFAPAIAPPLAIPPEDLRTLGQWSRSHSIRAALVERAKILRLAAEGTSNTQIARQVGCSRPTVILWRQRYTQQGLAGLDDQPRQGRPQTVRRDRRAETFKSSTESGKLGMAAAGPSSKSCPLLQVGCLAAVGQPDAKAQVIVGELAGRIDPLPNRITSRKRLTTPQGCEAAHYVLWPRVPLKTGRNQARYDPVKPPYLPVSGEYPGQGEPGGTGYGPIWLDVP